MPDRAPLVTGASSGIGLAIARLLRTSSHCVVPEIVFRRPGEATL